VFDLEDINDTDKLQKWICPVTSADIEGFYYGFSSPIYIPQMPTLPFQTVDYEAEFEHEKEKYIERLTELFDWETFTQHGSDIIKMQIKKLHQFRAMHFPVKIFFDSVPDNVEYSIKARHTAKIIRGEIVVIKQEV
jgi:hypothetical protein